MNTGCCLLLVLSLLVGCLETVVSVEREMPSSSATRDDRIARYVPRAKRSPLGKLPLLAGAALIGKKALLLGGAAVGAKALIGAGILGAGLYKAKYFSSGYGGGYASYNYEPPSYVESTWD